MKAGALRDRITVERQTLTGDDYGNTEGSWAQYGKFWADVRIVPGRERVAAGKVEAGSLATVRLRASALALAITGADRVVMRDATWNIRNAPIVAGLRREMVELLCETGVAT